MTNDEMAAALDLYNPAYLEIKVYQPQDFINFITYVHDNHIVLLSVDFYVSMLLVQNALGNNTRRIILIPQGQVL